MNILVTGGAGFIGSHLVDELLKDHKVLVLDDFTMGRNENLPAKHPNLVVFGGSILDETIPPLYTDIDIVYHLAALTRPRESFENPEETNRVNVEGTLRTLINASTHGVEKFVFVSSASAYGNQIRYPFIEEAIMKPVSPYAATKLIGEIYSMLFEDITDMKINAVRPFNVYGKRQDPSGPYGAAVPKFIDSLKNGVKPYITGDGYQFRDFIYVKDLVSLLLKFIDNDISGEVFNAGSGTKTSVNTLYETISRIMKKKVKPDYVDYVDDPNTQANIEKADMFLEWRPKYSLVEGLLETIE